MFKEIISKKKKKGGRRGEGKLKHSDPKRYTPRRFKTSSSHTYFSCSKYVFEIPHKLGKICKFVALRKTLLKINPKRLKIYATNIKKT